MAFGGLSTSSKGAWTLWESKTNQFSQVLSIPIIPCFLCNRDILGVKSIGRRPTLEAALDFLIGGGAAEAGENSIKLELDCFNPFEGTLPFPFFPGILPFRKPSEPQGKQLVFGKNRESTPRSMAPFGSHLLFGVRPKR